MIHKQLHQWPLLDMADKGNLTALPCLRPHDHNVDFDAKLATSLYCGLGCCTLPDRAHQQEIDVMGFRARFASMPCCPGSEDERLFYTFRVLQKFF